MNANDLVSFFQRATRPLQNQIRLMVGRCILAAIDDSKGIQEAQISVLAGESMGRIPRLQNFGFSSNPPVNSEAVVVALGGNRENLVVIACDNREVRFKNLASGESAIYTDDGTYIKLKKGGEIEVLAATKLTIDVPNSEIKGNVKIEGTLEVDDVATFKADIIGEMNASITGIVSASSFTGPSGGPMATTVDIQTTGNVSGGGTNLASIKSTFNSHTHNENETLGAPTAGPNTSL